MSSPPFGAILVCDDVRRENNGKEIIIGVYTGDIVIAAFPFQLLLQIWIEYIPPEKGRQIFHLRVRYGTSFDSKMKVETAVNVVAPLAISSPKFQIGGSAEGDLIIEFSPDGNEWTEIRRKKITKRPLASISPIPAGSGS